ncbi:uncharacterized protein RCH25_036533 [Pelodytes ibericus]
MGVVSANLATTITSALMAAQTSAIPIPGSENPIGSGDGRKALRKVKHSSSTPADMMQHVTEGALPRKRAFHQTKSVRSWKKAKDLMDKDSESDSDVLGLDDRSPDDSDTGYPVQMETSHPEGCILDPSDYIASRVRKGLDKQTREKLRAECPRPNVPDAACKTPEVDPKVAQFLSRSGWKSRKGLDYSLRNCQDRILDTMGPLAKIFELAETALLEGTAIDPNTLRGWAQRAICFIGNANTAVASERRKAIMLKIEPKLIDMPHTEPGPKANGLLFGDTFVKDLGSFVQTFTALDKAQSRVPLEDPEASNKQQQGFQQPRAAAPTFFPQRGRGWQPRGFRGAFQSDVLMVSPMLIVPDSIMESVMPTVRPFSEQDAQMIDMEVLNLQRKGAIVPGTWEPNGFISSLFLVPKKGGGSRPVINLRPHNDLVLSASLSGITTPQDKGSTSELVLRSDDPFGLRSSGRVDVVAATHGGMEWQSDFQSHSGRSYFVRRQPSRLGCFLRSILYGRTLGYFRAKPSHQLPGIAGRYLCDQEFRLELPRMFGATVHGQRVSCEIHQSSGRHEVNSSIRSGKGILAILSGAQHLGASHSHSGLANVGVDWSSRHLKDAGDWHLDLLSPREALGPNGNGSFCITPQQATTEFFQLETRPGSGGNRRFFTSMVEKQALCFPSILSHRQDISASPDVQNIDSSDHPMVGHSTVVSVIAGDEHGLALRTTDDSESAHGSGGEGDPGLSTEFHRRLELSWQELGLLELEEHTRMPGSHGLIDQRFLQVIQAFILFLRANISLFVASSKEYERRTAPWRTAVRQDLFLALRSSDTCNLKCGQKLQQCSCHASCENLQTCCTDYYKLCLQITPYSGTLMGGKDFTIQALTFNININITCRFNNETATQGYVDELGFAHCISPLLFETGRIPFTLSVNGENTVSPSGTWLAVHHSKASETEKSELVNSKKWQYYGTPGYNGTLSLKWNSSLLQAQNIRIEVWGYNETGDPYTDSWHASWDYLYTLSSSSPNNGNFNFTPSPAKSPFDKWEVGMLRILATDFSEGERNVQSLWSPVHALAWHLEESFRNDSAAWAYEKCMVWKDAEINKLPNFLTETPDCPCTLAQSRADTGRYHTDYGCNIEKNSVCTYHPGAVHCVRSIQASPTYASGQQCCYDANGAQVLTTDSLGGSTPDRGHDWGSPPYRKPPMVPGFSHWLYDVITFYYCCLWSDNCQYYLQLRPSSDCRTYKPPRVASAFGDPHLITIDGNKYTFNGKGEYVLLSAPEKSLIIQGRTQSCNHEPSISASLTSHKRKRAAPEPIAVSTFSSVVMQEGTSDVIEVRLSYGSEGDLETLLNGEVISFAELSWLDLKGVFVYSGSSQNVTVMFPSGAGVEVREKGIFLFVTVLLPEEYLNKTQGLLGVMNDEPADDFTFPNGTILSPNATHEELFQFGAAWAVTNESTLFTYDYPDLIEDYQIKHDPNFLPTFTIEEDPSNPLLEQIHETCGPDPFCRFDALVTNSINIGNATRMSHLSHVNLMQSLQPVVSCGWLAPPENGTKSGTTYIEGSVVQFSCNKGFILIGSRQRTCLSDGTWSGNRAQCLLGETNSCASQCGQKILDCSCEVTCENLGICCLDYRTYCIRISPESGLLMGGRDFTVLNVVFSNSSGVKCRFNYDITTDGYIDDTGHAHCISPLLYETGRIAFEMSIDGGQTYPHSSTWLSVHPGKVSELEKCTLLNDTKWQYYGTPNVDGTLTVTWDPKTFKESLVNIEVWGYQELGKPYTSSWTASWKYLYSLEKQYENNGSFTFLPKPAKPEHAVFEFGSLRINPSQYQDGLMNVHSLWSVDHAMAWHLGEDFRKDSASWAHEKCLDWHKSDQSLPNFLSEIIDCPCTMAQSISDTGRFHPDYGCDIGSHSVCTYHPGAVHCVRGIYGSPLYAAGQQCCYDSTGVQVLTSDSIGGSTPDRGHDWGSPPYKKPPRIPGFSHWLYDVVSFYYCCLWSDNCHYYLELRPSSDCRTYKPPKVASAFGDPHLITHDGANYTFKGKGEYVLVTSTYKSLNIQGRTQPAVFPNGTIISVAGFSSLAMQENNTDVIEVRLAGSSQRLEVLLNKEVVNFDRSWIDLKGVFLYSPTNQNVTVMFPSGAGVEVRGRGSFLGVTVLLPDEFMNKTQGLLGVMNQDPTDDFTFRNGTTLPPNASPQELFQLGADWSVTEETSLFTYDSKFLLDTYNTKHDPQFIPTFTVSEDPNDLINGQMNELCESDQFCRFDVLTTRDLGVGNATKLSHFYHRSLVENLKPVVSCGWLKPPTNGKKEGTSYLVNSDVTFTCNKGYMLVGAYKRTCQSDGTWTGQESHCVPDNTLGIVLGCVFGFFTLLVLIVLIALNEKKRSKKKQITVPPVTYQPSNE